jgi:hypothetical protein
LAYLGEMCGVVSLVESNEEARQRNGHWWKMITYFYLLITRNMPRASVPLSFR